MRIEAVTVCVDYADFLEQTLPSTLDVVDDLVVVTAPQDGRTKQLCAKYGVRCLPTECFYTDGEPFNKARGINYGLINLSFSDWVLHIDADTVLPKQTRKMLHNTQLEPTKLYGCDRVNCHGRDMWDKIKQESALQYEWSCLIHPQRNLPIGSRIAHLDYGGYCPIGFFQLWHPNTSNVKRYPHISNVPGTAERTDVIHALQWKREDRVLIPEMFAIHLSTRSKGDSKSMGQNWNGRTTPEFTLEEGPYVRRKPISQKTY